MGIVNVVFSLVKSEREKIELILWDKRAPGFMDLVLPVLLMQTALFRTVVPHEDSFT